jgi:hypothetical protein
MDQFLTLSGYVHPVVSFEEKAIMDEEPTYVEDMSIISRGFCVQQTDSGVQLGYLFNYDGDRIQAGENLTLVEEMSGWAQIDQVSILDPILSPAQAYEKLQMEAPEIAEMLDDALLNANFVVGVIEWIGGF